MSTSELLQGIADKLELPLVSMPVSKQGYILDELMPVRSIVGEPHYVVKAYDKEGNLIYKREKPMGKDTNRAISRMHKKLLRDTQQLLEDWSEISVSQERVL